MAVDYKKEWEQLKIQLKAFYFNRILSLQKDTSSLLYAFNRRQFFSDDKGSKIDNMSVKDFKLIMAAIKAGHLKKADDSKDYSVTVNNKRYSLDMGRSKGYLKGKGYTDDQIEVFPVIKLMILDSVLYAAGTELEEQKSLLNHVKSKQNSDSYKIHVAQKGKRLTADQRKHNESVNELMIEDFQTLNEYKNGLLETGIKFFMNDEYSSEAAKVFANCESQLRMGNVPNQYKKDVNDLVDATAKILAGDDSAKIDYQSKYEVLPHKFNWAKFIKGAAVVFFGAVLVAASVTLAVHTFGISTPLSMLGLAVGIDMIAAGLAIGAAVATGSMLGAGLTYFTKNTMHDLGEIRLYEAAKDFDAQMKPALAL